MLLIDNLAKKTKQKTLEALVSRVFHDEHNVQEIQWSITSVTKITVLLTAKKSSFENEMFYNNVFKIVWA